MVTNMQVRASIGHKYELVRRGAIGYRIGYTEEEMDGVHAMADQLRQYATHFAPRDWDYTRDTGDLHPLRYGSRWPHVKSALRYLTKGCLNIFPEEKSMRPGRIAMARAALRGWHTEPDGVLDGGCIITIWEETGEYLQYVQPTVGAMIADWMDADPESPHAQRVAAEMKRINDRYGARIAADDRAEPDAA